MSVRVATLVWRASRARGSQLTVLLCLADFASDDGSDIYPSVALIAERTRFSRSTVKRALHALAALGEVEIEEGRGRGLTNRYRICIDRFTCEKTVQPEPITIGKTVQSAHDEAAEKGSSCAKRVHPRTEKGSNASGKGFTGEPRSVREPLLDPPENREGAKSHRTRVVKPDWLQAPMPRGLTVADLEDVELRYSARASPAVIHGHINAALNHTAVDKAKNKKLYLVRWLGRDLPEGGRPQQRSNGTGGDTSPYSIEALRARGVLQ